MNVGDIVAVIPAYNDQEGLATTLRSLDRFGLAMIVAVDDGSEPPLEAPHDLYTPFKLVRHDKNKGPAAARNTGLSAPKSDWVYFTDCGCIHQPDIFVSYSNASDSNVSAFIGPVVATTQGRLGTFYTKAGILNPPLFTTNAAGIKKRIMNYKTYSEDDKIEAVMIITCNALVSRAAIDKVGYFDEKLKTNEDTDLGWRLSKVGKIVWCKYAELAHDFTESLDVFDSRFKEYGKGARLLSNKHNFGWTDEQFFIFSEDIDLSERRNQRWAEGFNSILET